MTKRHFEQFARLIKADKDARTNAGYPNRALTRALYTAEMIANVAAQDNPRFDRARFMRACGLES